MALEPGPKADSLAAAVTEVSEKMSVLVREEIELAKAEVTTKVTSIARGAAAVAAGAVFGVFALVFVLLSIAWAHQRRSPTLSGSASWWSWSFCSVLTAGRFPVRLAQTQGRRTQTADGDG